tara:strand:+ start:1456 stop:1794 length:339 start_codon:yes stop_codon:yes gene_type:complete
MNPTNKWYVFHTRTNNESTTVTLISHLTVWVKDLLAGKVKVVRVSVPSDFDISLMEKGMEIPDCPHEGTSITLDCFKALMERASIDLYLKDLKEHGVCDRRILLFDIDKYFA